MQRIEIPLLLRRLWAIRLKSLLKTKPAYIERLIQHCLVPPTSAPHQALPLNVYASKSPQRLLERFMLLSNTMTSKYEPIFVGELIRSLNDAITEYNDLLKQSCTEKGVYITFLPNGRYRAIHAARSTAIALSGLNEAAFRAQYHKTDPRVPPASWIPEYQPYRVALEHSHRVIEGLGNSYTVLTQPMEHVQL